jgi:hypothetical protein
MSDQKSPSALHTLKSVMLTMLGVHSQKNTDEDAKGPGVGVYIGVFAFMTVALMITVAIIVSSVIPDK